MCRHKRLRASPKEGCSHAEEHEEEIRIETAAGPSPSWLDYRGRSSASSRRRSSMFDCYVTTPSGLKLGGSYHGVLPKTPPAKVVAAALRNIADEIERVDADPTVGFSDAFIQSFNSATGTKAKAPKAN
jgi:hypothetical protein